VYDNNHFVLMEANMGHSVGLIVWKFLISYVAGVAVDEGGVHLRGVYSPAYLVGTFESYYFDNCT
jgi:predicted membrane protein